MAGRAEGDALSGDANVGAQVDIRIAQAFHVDQMGFRHLLAGQRAQARAHRPASTMAKTKALRER